MAEISKRSKRLVAEFTVLICIASFWVVRSTTFGLDDIKAGVFKQVVKVDSENADAHRFLADYYMDSGSYKKAIDALLQVLKIEPNDARAHSMLGDAYWNCERYEEAIISYKQAVKLQVDDPHVRYSVRPLDVTPPAT